MTKYFFIENGKINGCGMAQRIDAGIKSIEVKDEVFSNFIEKPNKYIYHSGKIIENPEFEKLQQQKTISEQISSLTLKLEELDKKRIRAICENSIKDEKISQTWLEYYNEEVNKIRTQITELSELLTI